MDGRKILLVDGDTPLRRLLVEQLAGLAPGMAIALLESAVEAIDHLAAGHVVIVAGGSTADQAALAQAAQSTACSLVALIDDPTVSATLEEAGAAVLAKPVRLADLAQAIRAALRPAAVSIVTLGVLRFDPATRELALGGAGPTVRLTEKEAAILAYLARAQGRVVPREELLAQVWGYDAAVATHTLETHVYRLRRKLVSGTEAAEPLQLIGEANGYRLAIPDPASASTVR